MYTVQDDSNLTTLETRLARGHRRRSYTDCVGRDHKVNHLRVDSDGDVVVIYRNKDGASFAVTVHFALLSLDLTILKGNRYYTNHQVLAHTHTDSHGHGHGHGHGAESDHVVRTGIPLVGITVGDIIRHFHHTHSASSVPAVLDEDPQENEKLTRLVNKAQTVDLSGADPADPLGVYVPRSGTLYPWEELRTTGHLPGDRTMNLEGFCRRIVYLSESTLDPLTKRDKEGVVHVDRDLLRRLCESLTSPDVVRRLLRYHLYNEDPEVGRGNEVEYFDPPRSIPEILRYLHEKTRDDVYMRAYHKVMKRLNHREHETLQTKYKDIIFVGMDNIPKEYPAYALRNVYLRQCTGRDMLDVGDHERNYKMMRQSDKWKHRAEVREGETTVAEFKRTIMSCRCERCVPTTRSNSKDQKRTLQQEIDDGFEQLAWEDGDLDMMETPPDQP